jgi:hypothetical protein
MSAITMGTVGRGVSRTAVALALVAVLAMGLVLGVVAGRATAPAASGAATSSGIVLPDTGLRSPGQLVHLQVMRKMNRLGS